MCEQRRPVTSRNYKREQKANATGKLKGGGGKDTGHWDTGTTGQRDQKQLCILSMGIKLAVASRVDSTQLQMSNRSSERVRAGKRQDILLGRVARGSGRGEREAEVRGRKSKAQLWAC